MRTIFGKIPEGTNIVISHSPPLGILDLYRKPPHALTKKEKQCSICKETHPLTAHLGLSELLRRIEAIKPQVHIFGHVHESFGIASNGSTNFINAAQPKERKAIVFDVCI
jgi:Icc-related predicted phosphoesterase